MLAARNWIARPVVVALLVSAFVVQPLGSGFILPPPPAAVAQFVSIPQLALWASNMVTYGGQNCTRLANESVNYYLTHTAGSANDDDYYDAERVFYQIADYTGNTATWNACAHIAQGIYRDQYVIPNLQNGYNNTAVPGYTVFTTGLRKDYERTGDVTSQNAVFLLSLNAAFAPDWTPLAWTVSADTSREVAYAILSYINAQALGQAPRQRRIDLVNQAYGHMNQWFVSFSWPGPWQQTWPATTSRLAPFMVALTAHTLIRDWEQTKDARLIPALTLAADWLWANAWMPAAQAMWYDSTNTSASGAAPDLNLLIAPIYAFLYWQTGDTKYRDEGDQIFAGGVQLSYLGDGKHVDQNYWWSSDYVKWRSLPPVSDPPTVSMTAPAAGATVAGTILVSASATSSVGIVGVQFQLDGINLGAAVTVAPYAVSWDTTTATNAPHTLTAVATDTAGHTTTSAPDSVTVNNAVVINPPAVSMTAPAAGATVAGTIPVSASATSSVGIAGVQFQLDGINLGATVTAAPYAVSWDTTTATNATHALTAVAIDTAAHTTTSAPVGVTVANSAANNGGLVAYWRFDEGAGGTATDSSGNGNTGTLVNGPVWTTGEIGGALAFNGTSSYVNVPSTAALDAYPLTIAVWMKTSSTSGVVGIVNKYVAYSANGWNLFLNNGNLCAWYYANGSNMVYPGGGCPFSIPGYNDNQWHHVVFVVDATGGTLYVDGIAKGNLPWTGTPGAPTTTQPVHIAHYPGAYGGAEYFPGVLDDVRIYNRALSSDVVQQLYALESTGVAP